ncbi:MAG: flavodoxin family protein [Acidimicrobiales bacterium]
MGDSIALVPVMLVVSHTQTGGTRALVDALVAGARHDDIDDVTVVEVDALEATVDHVTGSDLVVLATPENFGYMSGALKVFLDRVYYPLLEQQVRRPYQLLVKAGNDGSGAVSAVERIISGLGWPVARPPLLVVGKVGAEHLEAATELGLELGASLDMGLL